MAVGGYDYIVIGSGSAGGLLTYRLTEARDIKVLLLEAGGREGHWSIRMPAAARNNFMGGPRNWCFETEPEPHMFGRRIFQPRGKVIGGSSSLNGMVFVRGHRRDYDGWAADGAPGWGYDEVLPHFRSLERYLPGADAYRGDGGPIVVERLGDHHPIEQAFLDAAQQAGHAQSTDYNGAEQEGVTPFDANIFRGERCGTAAACIAPARARPNLTIATGAQVTKIVIGGGRAVGVDYVQSGQVRQARCEREVILSAGAIQSPQILMLSGIGPADHLRDHGIAVVQDLPGVGENLQDHLEVHIKHRCPGGLAKNRLLRKHRMALIGLQWFLAKAGPGATTHSRIGGFLRTDAAADYPNMQFHFWPYFLEGWSPPPHKDGYCFDVGPTRSNSRGWVRLASADPLAKPLMRLNGLSTERDLEEFRACLRITREIARQSAFDFCRGPEVAPGPEVTSDADIDDFVRANANSAYHPSGTCKMGSDVLAVVDPELKVHGVTGLRVADASIIPTIPNGNLNAPSLMIGERAASLIRNQQAS